MYNNTTKKLIPTEKKLIKLSSEISLISSGTMATLISNEGVGEHSSRYSVIDGIQSAFKVYVESKFKNSNIIYKTWNHAWDDFKSEVNIKELADTLNNNNI